MDGAPPIDGPTFRRVMARGATGVSVVSARELDTDGGLTVNALF